MVMFELSIFNKDKIQLASSKACNEVVLAYRDEYQEGDYIELKTDKKDIYVKLRLDDSLQESIVYLKDFVYIFKIPFGELKKGYGQKAFSESRHWGYVSLVDEEEYSNYRNLALNSFDTIDNTSIYPHAITNVKTDNPQFFARNVIDGVIVTNNHGSWPHNSWGINRQDDAWLKIDFGKMVEIDKIILYLRADFPHDNWWRKVTLTFSNGYSQRVKLEKSGLAQSVSFEKQKVSWVLLSDLIMSNEESQFPALSQIKVMGRAI